jgi:hypothetical protein
VLPRQATASGLPVPARTYRCGGRSMAIRRCQKICDACPDRITQKSVTVARTGNHGSLLLDYMAYGPMQICIAALHPAQATVPSYCRYALEHLLLDSQPEP